MAPWLRSHARSGHESSCKSAWLVRSCYRHVDMYRYTIEVSWTTGRRALASQCGQQYMGWRHKRCKGGSGTLESVIKTSAVVAGPTACCSGGSSSLMCCTLAVPMSPRCVSCCGALGDRCSHQGWLQYYFLEASRLAAGSPESISSRPAKAGGAVLEPAVGATCTAEQGAGTSGLV